MKVSQWLLAAAGTALMIATPQAATAAAAPTAPDGATLFRQRCQTCHSVDASRPSKLGPTLAGVVGRKAASTAFNYSPALKASNLTWTKANLDRYLAAPSRLVPGSRMVITLPDPAQRTAVIDYLAKTR